MGRVTSRTPVVRVDLGVDGDSPRVVHRPDTLAVEEPLEVRVDGDAVVVTMRTPGDDLDLALGFLLTEGLLRRVDDVATAVHCSDRGPDGLPTDNVLEVSLRPGTPKLDLAGRRTFGMTSACGVCGSASIEAVQRRSAFDVAADPVVVDVGLLVALPERLREAQTVFDRTGGLHAAGLFTADGQLLAVAEDVGRHNAVDKVLGRGAREVGWPLRSTVLQVSGRASFELVQKAWCAGVPVLSAVSAPSSLAVALADRAGMTLAGFVRAPRFNAYSRADRLRLAPEPGPDAGADAGSGPGVGGEVPARSRTGRMDPVPAGSAGAPTQGAARTDSTSRRHPLRSNQT